MMIHGDDKGAVIPPQVSENQVVLVRLISLENMRDFNPPTLPVDSHRRDGKDGARCEAKAP
jgi:hypothetical protein